MDQNIAKEVADKVAASILRADRKKASVAAATGIPSTTFARKINGHVEFGFSELLRIAAELNVNPSEFTPTAFAEKRAA